LVAVALAALVLVNGVSAFRRTSLLAAVIVALAVAAPPGYWRQMSTIMSPSQDYNFSSVDGRSALIKRGMGYMAQYPVFGIGIWNFAKAECTLPRKVADIDPGGPLRCTAPHNSLLQVGTELGVPGLIVWASLLIGGIIAPLRLRRRLPVFWRRGTATQRFLYATTSFLPVAMIGFGVTSLFVTFGFAEPIYMMAAFVTGLYIAIDAEIRASGGVIQSGSPSPAKAQAGWRVRAAGHVFRSSPNRAGAR
jgi:O-antigen ligase